jgi:glutamate--cysteine ligase
VYGICYILESLKLYGLQVRLKRYLEMRGADGGSWRRLCALSAFWVGLLYDEESLQGALDIIGDWTVRERAMLRRKVPQGGLKVPFRDGLLKHVAQDVYKLAKDGLLRRGYKEVGFLNVIEETVRTGTNHYFLPSFTCLVNCQQCLELRL